MHRLLSLLPDQVGGFIGASAVSVLGTMGVANQTLPVPEGVPPWIAMLIAALGPVASLVAARLLAAAAAKRRAIAEAKEARAKKLESDNEPGNDAEAAKLLEEAAGLKAEAAQLEGLRNGKV